MVLPQKRPHNTRETVAPELLGFHLLRHGFVAQQLGGVFFLCGIAPYLSLRNRAARQFLRREMGQIVQGIR